MKAGVRERALGRLRALMARTVANGASEQEELVAARMVAKAIAQLDAVAGEDAPVETVPATPDPSWVQAERNDPEYKMLLEKNTLEGLLKAAVQELALNHINTVSPPRRRIEGEPVERVSARELLEPHLGMMLAPGGTLLARRIIRQSIEELIYDGALPRWLDIPLAD